LAITEIIVPTYVKFGTTAVLLCQYDLDDDSLYSVKWYKGSHGNWFIKTTTRIWNMWKYGVICILILEFFRHVPNDVPSFRIFPWANFTVEVSITLLIDSRSDPDLIASFLLCCGNFVDITLCD